MITKGQGKRRSPKKSSRLTKALLATAKTKKKLDDRFTREMTETAEGMRSVGVMDEAACKLTMRDLIL